MEEPDVAVREIVGRSLAEDEASRDETTRLLVERDLSGRARVVAKGGGIVSGHEAAREVFRELDAALRYDPLVPDGGTARVGETIVQLSGRIAAILSGERTALNFLQHLSGVATLTARFVAAVSGTGVVILDTRKTTPGLRALEKRAVLHGGGRNHRSSLAAALLVKENHIAAAGGFAAATRKLGARLAEAEIEVRSIAELRRLAGTPPRRIMLDNFTPETVAEAVAVVRGWGGSGSEIEVSGGITLDNVADYAVPGVGYISIGALTAQAPILDMSLLLEGVSAP